MLNIPIYEVYIIKNTIKTIAYNVNIWYNINSFYLLKERGESLKHQF